MGSIEGGLCKEMVFGGGFRVVRLGYEFELGGLGGNSGLCGG